MAEKKPSKEGDALRARANNRAFMMKTLSDPEARLARIIMEHIADVLDGDAEPKHDLANVVKRPGA